MFTITNLVSRAAAALTLGVAIAATVSVASAEPVGKQVSVEFRYDSADSTTYNYRLIERQARAACENEGPRSLRMRQLQEDCTAKLLDMAVTRIGVQQLAELHHAKTGRWAVEPVQTAANGR